MSWRDWWKYTWFGGENLEPRKDLGPDPLVILQDCKATSDPPPDHILQAMAGQRIKMSGCSLGIQALHRGDDTMRVEDEATLARDPLDLSLDRYANIGRLAASWGDNPGVTGVIPASWKPQRSVRVADSSGRVVDQCTFRADYDSIAPPANDRSHEMMKEFVRGYHVGFAAGRKFEEDHGP